MNPEMLQPINTFVDTMIASKEKFEEVRVQINKKDAAVSQCIDGFNSNVNNLLSTGLNTEDEDLKRLYESARKSLQELLRGVAEDMERTRKGTEFIRKYEQSFNVAVFGKVKAGKSYLGNFIMGNRIRDMGLETSFNKLERPTVEVHEKGKVTMTNQMAEIDPAGQEELPEDANECTSAIQLFRLGGMTWFDTPGIGSVTWDNELLAKDYVDNADLVVFTCNSDAAGTRQDFSEMKTLHEKGKPFLLLLTQSDTLEEDYDDEAGELISVLAAKPDKDRTDTEQYMVGELQKIGIQLKNGELLTISAKLAIEALKHDNPDQFRGSHMAQFLQVLTNITKTEGAELKQKTPNDRINATIGDIMKRLDKASEELAASKKALLDKQKRLSTHGDQLLTQMQQECLSRVDALIRQKVAEVERNKTDITPEELGTLLSKEIYQVLLRTCADEFASSVEVLSDYAVQMDVASGIAQKKDTITYTIQTVEWVERDPEGIIEHVRGFLGKTYYRAKQGTKTLTHEIELGVNEQQAISLAHDQLDKLFQTEVPGLMKKISGRYLAQVTKLLDDASAQLQTTHRELEKLKC